MPLSRERIAELQRLRAAWTNERIFYLMDELLNDIDELLAAAERDADVRVLDEWAESRCGRETWGDKFTDDPDDGCTWSLDDEFGAVREFHGPTLKAARHAAAQAIEKELET